MTFALQNRRAPALALVMGALFSAQLLAQTPATTPTPAPVPGADRQARQQARVAGGMQSGQLSANEAAKLENKQARVDRAQTRMAADGTVTDAERQRLRKLQKADNHAIQHKLDNSKTGS